MRRTFRPRYISFAGTYQCNLDCPHCCVPIEWPDRLDIAPAIRFLESAHRYGIRIVGITGGEPFLYPQFLFAMTRRASALKFRFDKVMTNGVWHADTAHLTHTLMDLREAGFTGKLGLSVDKFHGVRHAERLAEFCRAARRVFDRDTIVSLSYASRSPHAGLEPIRELAGELDGLIEWSPALRRHLLVTPELTMVLNWNHLAPVERAERFDGGWDGTWFEEDYCEGPGQALIVTPRGEVKPCCGFASDLDQLTIGTVDEDVHTIVRNARRHPYVGKVFRDGLTAIRDEILARDPNALPGAASNQCFFCWWVLTRGMAEGVPGGGGQVGAWTGIRANADGQLLQLGTISRQV
jgi:pyruvate-formate lyase-activating enzyme